MPPDVQTARSAGNCRVFDHVQQDGPDGRELSELTSAITLNRVTSSACHDYIAHAVPRPLSAATYVFHDRPGRRRLG